jgi:hypothetical protein
MGAEGDKLSHLPGKPFACALLVAVVVALSLLAYGLRQLGAP